MYQLKFSRQFYNIQLYSFSNGQISNVNCIKIIFEFLMTPRIRNTTRGRVVKSTVSLIPTRHGRVRSDGSKHAQSLGDGVDAFRLRPIASRLHESRHARRVGRRAFGPPVRVHQLFGPRLRRRRQGDGSAALEVLSLEAARSSARVWGRAPRGLASPWA